MYPLDFEEFCTVCGVQPDTLAYLKECFDNLQPVADSVHASMLQLFYTLMVVGGMPQRVSTYLDAHDTGRILEIQHDILALYRIDIARYSDKDKEKIGNIFDAIPSQLEAKNRRFVLSDISKVARQQRYETSFIWPADAGVALPCYNVTQPAVPLALSEKRNLFKLFMCNTGLLAAASMQNIRFDILQGHVDVNLGSILENLFAQQPHTNGFSLHYYNSKLGRSGLRPSKGAPRNPDRD